MGAGGFEPPNTNVRGFTIPVLWPLGYTPLCGPGWVIRVVNVGNGRARFQ